MHRRLNPWLIVFFAFIVTTWLAFEVPPDEAAMVLILFLFALVFLRGIKWLMGDD